MVDGFQNFTPERQIVREKDSFLIGQIDQVPAIIKLTLPTAGMDNLSFYTGLRHRSFLKNDVYETASIDFVSGLDVEVICPATPSDIAELSGHNQVVRESYEEYCNSQPTPSWITRLSVDGLEACGNEDSIVHSNEEIVIIQHGVGQPFSLRWSCVFRDAALQSIRDISSVQMIERVKNEILVCLKELNVPEDRICLYFDYCGKGTRLCLSIANISRSLASLHCNGKFVYLDTLILNLKLNRDYYKDVIVMIRNR